MSTLKNYIGYTIDSEFGILTVVKRHGVPKEAKHDTGIVYTLKNDKGETHCARWSQEVIEVCDKAGDVKAGCKHERYNSRSDCEKCFGRAPMTIARTADEFGASKLYLENTLTGDWDYGPYPTLDVAADTLMAYNAGEEVPE